MAIAFNLVPAIAALAGLVFLTPPTPDIDPVVVISLVAISALAYLAEARLKQDAMVFFGAEFAIVLVAVAVCGPFVALAVWLVPDVIGRFVLRQQPRWSPGFVATISSYILAILTASWLLQLAGAPTGSAMIPALFGAGVAMALVNFCFARLTHAPFYENASPIKLIDEELFKLLPVILGMLFVGVLTAVLIEAVGSLTVLLLALVILMPRFAIERIARSTSVAKLERAEAIQVYVAAISDVLRLTREDREQLACAADLIEPINGDTSGINGFDWGRAHVSGAAMLALHAGERWAGTGWPAGLPADAIPYGSRILAVAQAWTDLTAKGTPELTQAEAMLSLAAQADTEFDPAIVDAALHVVADEAGFARDPDFQPKLHRMRLPRTLRRGALPTVMPRLVDVSPH
jgi:hypothetical protein